MRDFCQDVAAPHDVFLLFRRSIIGEQNLNVHVAEEIFRFLEVEAAGIFLEEKHQGVPGFGQLVFLAQLGCGLKFRETDIREGLDRNLAALLGDYFPLRLDEEVVTKKRSPSKNEDRE